MDRPSQLNRLGQFFIVGFKGASPSPEFLNFIAEEQIAGVILFEENCPDYDTTKGNISKIKKCYPKRSPLIAVDQEGGRISRLKGIPAEFHAPSYYGSANLLERFTEDYSHSAVYMESLGINLNLAPVADIYLNDNNDCLRDRCFGNNSEQVARFVEMSIEVAHRSGLLCCLKHFPGLGTAEQDPHHEIPEVDFDEAVWGQREFIPFLAGVKKGADMIMTTHMRLPKLDKQIVTGSEKIVSTLIREQLGFDGLIITDSLIMKGASELGEPGEVAVKAFNAGHDILLLGQDLEDSMAMFDDFVNACERGEVSEERIESAAQRVSGVKLKLDSDVLQ